MPTQIFVNLPVKDLQKSIGFFTKLGYTFNLNFTNENATCMIISESIYAMLLAEPFFKTFTKKEICDTSKNIEAIIALSCDSRAAVDELGQKAEEAGARIPKPADDQGFMYTRSFEDPDGHLWEIFYMDPAAIPQG
jgi:predicted lactoylglutathione lyase